MQWNIGIYCVPAIVAVNGWNFHTWDALSGQHPEEPEDALGGLQAWRGAPWCEAQEPE